MQSAISGMSFDSCLGSENHICPSEEFANTRTDNSFPVSDNSFQSQLTLTEKKPFISGMHLVVISVEVNPHRLKRSAQRERYVWYGAYEKMLIQANLMEILKRCKDSASPMETAAIHLDNFNVVLAEYKNTTKAFIKYDTVYCLSNNRQLRHWSNST
eukprot:TRINITY_DN12956_c0_g4_i2.p1 TRINITY_DN12956_c0_g4~~TRINITY_DN12956_c0_g4_i2.p1  ORF type:complete len:181 (+),score=28.62 TRINITY_DN12956_c0_g4_i2:75-545(+)